MRKHSSLPTGYRGYPSNINLSPTPITQLIPIAPFGLPRQAVASLAFGSVLRLDLAAELMARRLAAWAALVVVFPRFALPSFYSL